jgi:serine/threonine protein kinase
MSGVCKISDFGISKRTDDEAGAFTAMQGTVFWMAPEVVNTQKKGYNSKIDIWSVGCVVLEMWAGMRPWIGEEMVAVMFKVRYPVAFISYVWMQWLFAHMTAFFFFLIRCSSTKINYRRPSQKMYTCLLLATTSGKNASLCKPFAVESPPSHTNELLQ